MAMALTNLKVIKDEQTPQARAQEAMESYNAESVEPAPARLILIRKGRRLDVDAVLARSLPSLTGEGLKSVQEKSLPQL
jgi:hypothetical protein